MFVKKLQLYCLTKVHKSILYIICMTQFMTCNANKVMLNTWTLSLFSAVIRDYLNILFNDNWWKTVNNDLLKTGWNLKSHFVLYSIFLDSNYILTMFHHLKKKQHFITGISVTQYRAAVRDGTTLQFTCYLCKNAVPEPMDVTESDQVKPLICFFLNI